MDTQSFTEQLLPPLSEGRFWSLPADRETDLPIPPETNDDGVVLPLREGWRCGDDVICVGRTADDVARHYSEWHKWLFNEGVLEWGQNVMATTVDLLTDDVVRPSCELFVAEGVELEDPYMAVFGAYRLGRDKDLYRYFLRHSSDVDLVRTALDNSIRAALGNYPDHLVDALLPAPAEEGLVGCDPLAVEAEIAGRESLGQPIVDRLHAIDPAVILLACSLSTADPHRAEQIRQDIEDMLSHP